jgi:hypothetical protein
LAKLDSTWIADPAGYLSTERAGCLGSPHEKVNQAPDEMETQNNYDPNQLLDALEPFVGDGVDQHPNPKDGRSNSEAPNEYDEQQSNQAR